VTDGMACPPESAPDQTSLRSDVTKLPELLLLLDKCRAALRILYTALRFFRPVAKTRAIRKHGAGFVSTTCHGSMFAAPAITVTIGGQQPMSRGTSLDMVGRMGTKEAFPFNPFPSSLCTFLRLLACDQPLRVGLCRSLHRLQSQRCVYATGPARIQQRKTKPMGPTVHRRAAMHFWSGNGWYFVRTRPEEASVLSPLRASNVGTLRPITGDPRCIILHSAQSSATTWGATMGAIRSS